MLLVHHPSPPSKLLTLLKKMRNCHIFFNINFFHFCRVLCPNLGLKCVSNIRQDVGTRTQDSASRCATMHSSVVFTVRCSIYYILVTGIFFKTIFCHGASAHRKIAYSVLSLLAYEYNCSIMSSFFLQTASSSKDCKLQPSLQQQLWHTVLYSNLTFKRVQRRQEGKSCFFSM